MKCFVVTILLFSEVLFSAAWDYELHGADWYPVNCPANEYQSPIRLVQNRIANSSLDLELHYQEAQNFTATVTGRTVKITSLESLGSIFIEGVEYSAEELHFHAPGEHTLSADGVIITRFPLELHIVHASEAGDVAVVGVWYDTDANALPGTDPLIAGAIGAANAAASGPPQNFQIGPPDFTVASLFAPSSAPGFFSYPGSLTTPPCSEGVKWLVHDQVRSIADEDINTLAEYVNWDNPNGSYRIEQNAGPVQHNKGVAYRVVAEGKADAGFELSRTFLAVQVLSVFLLQA